MADFFLPPDEAKTLGDINYMRKKIKVKRTFAKGASNPDGGESVREISAEDKFELAQNGRKSINSTNPTFATKSYADVQPNVKPGKKLYINDDVNTGSVAPSPSFDAVASEAEQSIPGPSSSKVEKTSTSMDMFRNMAKNLGK
jgi:hypothetical protein